jgi:Fic family protein
MSYPPYTITKNILNLVAQISELLGGFQAQGEASLHLRRANRIRSIHGSLAIENNTLSLDEVTAVIKGQRVLAPAREIQEVQGAFAAYEQMDKWSPARLDDLLAAHALLMQGLMDKPGELRESKVGVFRGEQMIHQAPPPGLAQKYLRNLLAWLEQADEHPLIASSIFHYEFEFLHPFVDGNGRMGRLWQTLILSQWKPIMAYLPVESIIHDQQEAYYQALSEASQQGEATFFIEYMLQAILYALRQAITTDQVTDQVKRLLRALGKKESSLQELMRLLSLRHARNFRANYLNPALDAGLVERTQPDSPNSPTQRYRLTSKGRQVK